MNATKKKRKTKNKIESVLHLAADFDWFHDDWFVTRSTHFWLFVAPQKAKKKPNYKIQKQKQRFLIQNTQQPNSKRLNMML